MGNGNLLVFHFILKYRSSLKCTPLDIVGMVLFFWYFVKYVALIPIGYTAVLVILVSIVGHLLVYLR